MLQTGTEQLPNFREHGQEGRGRMMETTFKTLVMLVSLDSQHSLG